MGGSGGLGGGLTDAVYGTKESSAAQNAAQAQDVRSSRLFGMTNTETRAINRQATRGINRATTQGLASLDRDIANQERNLSRQEQLISQIDPTVIEASQQALRLLRGEESSTLAPLKNQRATQRQKLVSMLREQLGPGAETSTAGIQALTRFDAETDNIFAGAQQQALSNLGGLSSQFTSQRPDIAKEIALLSGYGQNQNQLRMNQANNIANLGYQRLGALQAPGQAYAGTAGAGFVKDLIQGQQNTSRTNAWADSSLRFGEAFGGMGMGSMGGGGGGGGQTSNVETAGSSYRRTNNLA